MMEGILFANIAASAAVLIILLLRRFFRDKFSSAVFVLLWLAVVARLLLPFNFSSTLSIYNAKEEEPIYYQQEEEPSAMKEIPKTPVFVYYDEESISEDTPDNKNVKISGRDMLFCIHVSGAVICGIYFAAAHIKNVQKIMECAVPFYDLPEGFETGRTSFYKSENLKSPLSFGLLRPAVVIPEQITKEQLPFALLHEQTHIKNRDAALKTAALAALLLNWFNPFSWIMVKYLVRDMERLCDEKVLSLIGDEKAPLYANAILDFAEKESLSLSFFSAASLRERVISIMKNKTRKKCLPAVLCVFTALIIVMTACGTSPREPEKEPIKAGNLSETIQNAAEKEPQELLEIENGGISSAAEENSPEEWQEAEEGYEYTVPGDFGGYRVDFTWPCERTDVNCGLWGYKGHTGIDIGEGGICEIYAAAAGTVIKVQRVGSAYGWHMIIDHGNEVSTLYAHCSEMYVHEGQKVEKGELIGLTGSSGNCEKPHLHFELRYKDIWLDPQKHIPTPEQEKVLSSYFEDGEYIFSFKKPCEGEITSAFGGERNHLGVDFTGEMGSVIYAAADGTVVRVREDGTGEDLHYGNNIIIDHGNGYQTLYAHCEEFFVKVGQEVKAGEVVASMGATGSSTGPNLHFELRINGQYTDPMPYME
ncbi:MAG: peptidoglycan DD-metalloendopeptidase family protein [Oscillospiraceae bacterium]|nr:peptidoglycan DD-metalloendopeptidase family protein [Oscillospiraceae bacterium]